MIDPQQINKVIEKFYSLAREDVLIGYHFKHINNFDEHLFRIQIFWEFQLNQTPPPAGYRAQHLIEVHRPLLIKRGEIGRWVKLFQETLQQSPIASEEKVIWMQKIYHFEKILRDKISDAK